MNETSAGPKREPVDRAVLSQRLRAKLRQATWEATQALSFDDVRELVEATLREVESDEP